MIDNSSSEEAPPPVILHRHAPVKQQRTFSYNARQLSIPRQVHAPKMTAVSSSGSTFTPSSVACTSGAVRNIAAKFAENENIDEDFGHIHISKPEGIRRTQSTKIQVISLN